LTQEPTLIPNISVLEEALLALPNIELVETELLNAEEKLADPKIYNDEKALSNALSRQAKFLEQFEALGGINYKSRVISTLKNLGFSEDDLNLNTEILSGGQKKLVGLAKLIITKPDLLLLDEPDNHLDLVGKTFLEKFIRGYKGGVVIVSHDRYLLDVVADEIVELEDGKLTVYPGNYSEYAYEKQARLARQLQTYQAQKKEITRLETSAKRLLTWGHLHDNEKFIKRGKNILKRIDRIDRIDKPVTDRKKMGLELLGWRGSNKVIEISQLIKSYTAKDGGQTNNVLSKLDLQIWHGERIGLVGPNGAGKSVLFRIILDQEKPESGEIKIGPSIKIGYYAQEHESLDYEASLIDTVRLTAPISENNAVKFLSRFLFSYSQVREKISTLSGGEKSRLQMALLMLSGANFLLLDEPTNNLDIPSAEVLETALSEFEGSV
ncbi:MAG: ATP-binding cassette domain-containing protein, partial [Chloroflexota bacterium]